MAVSGSFSGSIQNGHYAIKVDWSASQDIANNRTTITCNLYFVNDWSINIGARTNTVTIAGTSYTLNSPAYTTTGTHHIGSCSKTITHNPDGTLGNVALSATFNIKATLSGTYYESINASGTAPIDTIARASVPSCITYPANTRDVGYFGDTIAIYMNRKSSAFTHKVYYNFGTLTKKPIASDVTNYTFWSIPLELINEIGPSAKSGWGGIVVETYADGGAKLVGSSSAEFVASVPDIDATKPTTTMNISPSDIGEWVETDYVQGRSQVIVEMTASTKFKAGIKSYNVTVDGKTTTLTTSSGSAAVTTQVLNNSGTFSVVSKSVDTRDISSKEKTSEITVIPYGKPFITHNSTYGNIVCGRYDEEKGTMADNGTSIKLIIGAKWYSLSNKENTAKVEVKCVSSNSDSGWIPIEATEQGGGPENNYISYYDINTVIPGVTVAVDKTYQVYIRCTDRFGAYNADSETPYRIPTEDVCFHLGRGGNKAAFGKYAERDKVVEVASDWDLMLKGGFVADFPIETGVSNGWNYKLWNSGELNLSALVKIDTFGDTRHIKKYLNLPIKPTEMPIVNVTIKDGTAAVFLQGAVTTYSYDLANNVLTLIVLKDTGGVTNGVDAYVSVDIKGKWK